MAAFRKVFLALAVVAAVSSTAPSAFAQLSCTLGVVQPIVRVEGLTEYVGDLLITCTGGNPTASGTAVPLDDFEVDINDTNITSRLLGINLPTVNGGYAFAESLLIINEAFPKGGFQNPSSIGTPTVPPSEFSITQKACPTSNQGASCDNTGNGLGAWGTDGTDATSSYGATAGGYNVFQGYQYSQHATRFDHVPIDAPGSGLITIGTTSIPAQISVRITNIRVDGTPFAAATPATGFGPPIYATLTVSGSQPLTFTGGGEAVTNISIAYTEHTLKQVTATEVNSLICQHCDPLAPYSYDTGSSDPTITPTIYANSTFNYFAQENFASAFEAQTWFYDDNPASYEKLDPNGVTGSGLSHTHSTQDVTGYPYFSASNFYPNGDTDLSGINVPGAVGEATNGLRLVFSIADLYPGTTITAPAVAGIYGGTFPTGQTSIDGNTDLNPGPPDSGTVAGAIPSGVAILLGAVIPNGTVTADYAGPGSYYGFTPVNVTVTAVAANEPIQFVYEVMYADGGTIETLWVPFSIDYCALSTAPLPPPIATAQVGLGPVSLTDNNLPSVAQAGIGDYSFPRFIWGADGNPLAPQDVWYLTNCNCDLLFPYVAVDAGFDTGIAISNTSADPYGTPRSVGYVQFFYYLNSLVEPAFKTPKDAYGRALLGNDGPLAAGPGSIVGPHGGTYKVYTNSVYDPAATPVISARSSFQQITFNPVTAGDQFITLLSTGAWVNGIQDPGWAGVPGFEGYIFAISGFPYCHGYAFISNGTTAQTQGYLALVIDEGHFLRRSTSFTFEVSTGVLTTDPTWSYGTGGVISGGTPYPVINPRDTAKNDYNN